MLEKLSVATVEGGVEWTYVPGTYLSLPLMTFELIGIPTAKKYTIIIEKVGKVPQLQDGRFLFKFPVLKVENKLRLTVIDIEGFTEDWGVNIAVVLKTSSVFVDETCENYMLKIREVERTGDPSLIYMGCRPGVSLHHLAIDIFWQGVEKIEYRETTVNTLGSVVSVPLEQRKEASHKLVGVTSRGQKNVFTLEYDPTVPYPFELWAGLAYFKMGFEQSNFASKYTGTSLVFLGKFWFRPPDIPFSVMARGFGTILPFSNTLEPDLGYQESVKTYFTSVEAHYQLMDVNEWAVSPFFGAWLYFMKVESREFGIQRMFTSVMGVSVEKTLAYSNRVDLTIRLAPLQTFFNPLAFSFNEMYWETELSFTHAFMRLGRVFATLYYGSLNFSPSGFASTNGTYLVLGGGYGF